MKLIHLLKAYDFSEIMPAVNEMFPGTSKFRKELKQGYDIMMALTPVITHQAITYKIISAAKGNEYYVGAEDSCFNASWEICLGKDVVRSKGVNLSDLELAANCLVNLCLSSKFPPAFESAHAHLMR